MQWGNWARLEWYLWNAWRLRLSKCFDIKRSSATRLWRLWWPQACQALKLDSSTAAALRFRLRFSSLVWLCLTCSIWWTLLSVCQTGTDHDGVYDTQMLLAFTNACRPCCVTLYVAQPQVNVDGIINTYSRKQSKACLAALCGCIAGCQM